MKGFKLFWRLALSRKGTILGFLLFFIVFLVQIKSAYQDSINPEFTPFKVSMGINNLDQEDPVTEHLIAYLNDQTQVSMIEDNPEKIADAIYNEKMDYVLTIPTGYGASLLESVASPNQKPLTLKKQSSNHNPGAAAYIDSFLYTFWMNFNVAIKQVTHLEDSEQVQQTLDQLLANLTDTVEIIPNTEQVNIERVLFGQTYIGLAAYLFIMAFISLFSYPMIVGREKAIMMRESMTSVTHLERIKSYFLASFSMAILFWLFFMALYFITNGFTILFSQQGLLLILASFCCLIGIQGFCFFLSILSNSVDLSAFLQVVLSLLIAFGSGLFVPREFVNESFQTLVSIVSPIWQTKVSELILSSEQYSGTEMREIGLYLIIMVLIGLAYNVLSYLILRYRSHRSIY